MRKIYIDTVGTYLTSSAAQYVAKGFDAEMQTQAARRGNFLPCANGGVAATWGLLSPSAPWVMDHRPPMEGSLWRGYTAPPLSHSGAFPFALAHVPGTGELRCWQHPVRTAKAHVDESVEVSNAYSLDKSNPQGIFP